MYVVYTLLLQNWIILCLTMHLLLPWALNFHRVFFLFILKYYLAFRGRDLVVFFQLLFPWETLFCAFHFWRTTLPGKLFLVCSLFFSSGLWIYHPTPSCPLKFLLWNPLLPLLQLSCDIILFCYWFQDFLIILNFGTLIIMSYFSLPEAILFADFLTSYTWILKYFLIFEKHTAIIY